MTRCPLCIATLGSCLVSQRMAELQARVPTEVKTDDDLKLISELNMDEMKLHNEARSINCDQHNSYTLIFPAFRK